MPITMPAPELSICGQCSLHNVLCHQCRICDHRVCYSCAQDGFYVRLQFCYDCAIPEAVMLKNWLEYAGK